MPAPHDGERSAGLLDLRDELAVATQLVTALWLACQAPNLPSNESRALCALADTARERLDDCIRAADDLVAASRQNRTES